MWKRGSCHDIYNILYNAKDVDELPEILQDYFVLNPIFQLDQDLGVDPDAWLLGLTKAFKHAQKLNIELVDKLELLEDRIDLLEKQVGK